MINRLRVFRLFGVLAMAMQLVLPPALTIADGLIERDSPTSSHIEDHSRASCRPAHDADCAICRTLSNLSAPKASGPCVAILFDAPSIRREALLGARPAEPWFGPPPSRAPPV